MRLRPMETRMASAVRRLGGSPDRQESNSKMGSCFQCRHAGDSHCKLKPRVKLRKYIVCDEYKR